MRVIVGRIASSVWRWKLEPPCDSVPFSQKRSASTLVSATAINATKYVPSRNRSLYDALHQVRKKASGQTDRSRLQLAIQGLESEQPTTRIALLGVNGTGTARQLARLLLADSSQEHQNWEEQLVSQEIQQDQGVVIRHGDPETRVFAAPRSALPVLLVPSTLLQSQRIEILIASIALPSPNPFSHDLTTVPSDALLSPTFGTPISGGGRQSLISQPVHRTVLVAGSLDDLLGIGKLLSAMEFRSEAETRLIDAVVDLNGNIGRPESRTIGFDAAKAQDGLHIAREAGTGVSEYAQIWRESGMSTLSNLFESSSASSNSQLPESVLDLIVSLLESTSATIASETREAALTARASALSNESRSSLENAINTFSRQGHVELQGGLAAAWSSRNWQKLAFWKLYWRADDISLVVNDLVTNAWLPRTERAVYELSGRLKQAGVSLVAQDEPAPSSVSQASPSTATHETGLDIPTLLSPTFALASGASPEHISQPPFSTIRAQSITDPMPYTPPSIISTISNSRRTLINSAMTTLTSSAQQIVMKALTITGVSATLSTLSFLSTTTTSSLYESASILALGTAYALRRMQQEWEAQRKGFEETLMVEGKSALKETQEQMQKLVRNAAATRLQGSEVEGKARREASEAVAKAKAALDELR